MKNNAARPEKINRLNILINQVGYLTRGTKRFVVESNIDLLQPAFYIRDTVSGARAFQGQLAETNGDFGRYWTGDFTGFCAPGTYVIDVDIDAPAGVPGGRSSEIVVIKDDVYQPLLTKGLECFALQRCGPSTTGYHAPCHLDDGVRADNGQALDAAGGWHDASDLLKWSYTICGLLGLLEIAENSTGPQMRSGIYEEAKWGNRYFQKLQDPQGYFYGVGLGGDSAQEGNRWTDNVRGTGDERKICINIGQPYFQHMFITGQAHLAHLYRDRDASYARICLDAARRCFDWQKSEYARAASDPDAPAKCSQPTGFAGGVPPDPLNEYAGWGTGARAGMALFKATQDRACLDYAVAMADRFIQLQHTGGGDGQPQGYFHGDASKKHGVRFDFFGMIGFCGFIEEMRAQKQDASRWEQALALYCAKYLGVMAKLNAFGIVPAQVKLVPDYIPGSRNFGGLNYRYFKSPTAGVAQGNNLDLSATGIVLCKAARILGKAEYRGMAQAMLDWILGLNPFDVSLVNGMGYKNPPEYVFSAFRPRTPRIAGACTLGICGDAMDCPELRGGCWESAEICTPHTVQVMWLASALMQAG